MDSFVHKTDDGAFVSRPLFSAVRSSHPGSVVHTKSGREQDQAMLTAPWLKYYDGKFDMPLGELDKAGKSALDHYNECLKKMRDPDNPVWQATRQDIEAHPENYSAWFKKLAAEAKRLDEEGPAGIGKKDQGAVSSTTQDPTKPVWRKYFEGKLFMAAGQMDAAGKNSQYYRLEFIAYLMDKDNAVWQEFRRMIEEESAEINAVWFEILEQVKEVEAKYATPEDDRVYETVVPFVPYHLPGSSGGLLYYWLMPLSVPLSLPQEKERRLPQQDHRQMAIPVHIGSYGEEFEEEEPEPGDDKDDALNLAA